jgi:hypothetical protein
MDRYERGLGEIADLEGQLEIAKDIHWEQIPVFQAGTSQIHCK